MKANELRIGNFIRHFCARDKSNYIVVSSIHMSPDCTEINKDEQGSYYNIDDMEGIPITEEWLLKFGFKKFHRNYRINIGKDVIGKSAFLNCHVFEFISDTAFTFYIESNYQMHNIKHVHQLQNLYFALTGQELTIKQDAPA